MVVGAAVAAGRLHLLQGDDVRKVVSHLLQHEVPPSRPVEVRGVDGGELLERREHIGENVELKDREIARGGGRVGVDGSAELADLGRRPQSHHVTAIALEVEAFVILVVARQERGELRFLMLGGERREERVSEESIEGHAAADLADNPRLQELLTPDAPQDSARADQAWLGAAVEIKDPTAAIFRPQSGANLLIVGQNQRLANGMLTSAIVSLIAGESPQDTAKDARTQFVILDGEHDQPDHARLSEQLQILQPFGIDFCGPRESADKVKTILTEVRKRGEEIDQRFNPFFLLINDLGRFRDLQPKPDEFGFSGFGEEKADDPGKYLSEILREGPAVGVHTLVWADNYNNVSRWFDRPVLRDFAYRVLFQMSATDSSNLMDSAAASHLGPYRAFFHDDDRGQHEKFRPYGPPTSDLLDEVASWLNQRTVNNAQDESSTDACNMPTENRG